MIVFVIINYEALGIRGAAVDRWRTGSSSFFSQSQGRTVRNQATGRIGRGGTRPIVRDSSPRNSTAD